jgi:hypothetical protein
VEVLSCQHNPESNNKVFESCDIYGKEKERRKRREQIIASKIRKSRYVMVLPLIIHTPK